MTVSCEPGILNGMSETRRRFQFGLRKLLLWTAVVAILLGFLRMAGLGSSGFAIVACWIVVVAILPVAVSLKTTCRLSGLAGAVFTAWIFADLSVVPYTAPVGWFLGYTGALLMNGLSSAVRRADDLMESGTGKVIDVNEEHRKRRFQFSIRKLLLIVAVYAAAFGALSHLGAVGVVLAVVIGTSLSGLIVFLRKESVGSAAAVAAGSLIGAFFGFAFLSVAAYIIIYGGSHLTLEKDTISSIVGTAIGAIIGGFGVSLFIKIRGDR